MEKEGKPSSLSPSCTGQAFGKAEPNAPTQLFSRRSWESQQDLSIQE